MSIDSFCQHSSSIVSFINIDSFAYLIYLLCRFLSHRLNIMQERLDKTDLLIEEEKQKRRAAVVREVERRKAVQVAFDEMEEWVVELQDQLLEEQKRTRAAKKETKSVRDAKAKEETVSSQRLALLQDLRIQVHDLKDQLADESKQRHALERMQTIQLQIKRERPIGRRGGGSRFKAAAVSDVDRNDFLSRPTTKKEIEADERGLLHGLVEELKLTLIIMAMEDAPATRQSNNESLERQRKMKQLKEELMRELQDEKATEAYIEALIYTGMFDSDACWKTVAEVTAGLKKLKYKKDKEQALKDNIQIRYKGFGWTDWKTQWSHAGVKLTIPQLEKRLKDLIKTDKKNKRKPPMNPEVPVPEHTDMPSLGTTTTQTSLLDERAASNKDEFDLKARKQWKEGDLEGHTSVHQRKQPKIPLKVDELLIGVQFEYLCSVEDENKKDVGQMWCSEEN